MKVLMECHGYLKNVMKHYLMIKGAYAPPTVASTPIGDIPKTMYVFEKNKEPRK